MTKLSNIGLQVTTGAFFLLALGLITSVSILSLYQILFTVAVLYYTWRAFTEKSFSLPKSAYFLLAFAFVAILTSTINLDLIPRPSKNFGRIKYFAYGALGILVFKYWLKDVSDKAIKAVLHTFCVTIIAVGLISIFQVIIKNDLRANGLTHTLRYGYGSGMFLLILLGAILNHKKLDRWLNLRFMIVTFIFGFIGFYLTYTRGALLGFLSGLPFVLYFFNPKLGLKLGSLVLAMILILAGFYLFGTGSYGSRFLVNKNNYADVIRRSQWKAAIIATQERPVLGWGLSNFHSQLKRIKHQYDLDAKEYDDAHSHNLFLEVASGTGIVGLLAFLGWIISWAIECFRAKGLIRAIFVPFGVCFVISSQFEVTFDANNASLIFIIYSLSSWLAFKQRTLSPTSSPI
jgi:O-antigen ligase